MYSKCKIFEKGCEITDEKQIEELDKAISKLSEKDQEQIAAGSKITDEQCETLKNILASNPKIDISGNPIHPMIRYGGPRPRLNDLVEKDEKI